MELCVECKWFNECDYEDVINRTRRLTNSSKHDCFEEKAPITVTTNIYDRYVTQLEQLKYSFNEFSNAINNKENENMNTNFMNGMFGKVAPGMCRLSMSGGVAVKTSNGYKSYNVKTGRLTNCTSFVFDVGEDFFFVIPTNKVEIGDIILIAGKPKCVIEAEKNKITVINYEDSTIDTVLPERHVFMGSTYFYGKIVSMFGNGFMSGKKGMNKMMSYMMMSEMMKGANTEYPYSRSGMTVNNSMSSMLPMMMLMNGGNMSNMFEGMFDFDLDDEEEEKIPTESEEV